MAKASSNIKMELNYVIFTDVIKSKKTDKEGKTKIFYITIPAEKAKQLELKAGDLVFIMIAKPKINITPQP